MLTNLIGLLLWASPALSLGQDSPPLEPVAAASAAPTTTGQSDQPASSDQLFQQSLVPLLIARCLTCHGGETVEGGYSLATPGLLLTPGDSRLPPIVPGNLDDSELLRRLLTDDEGERMPAEGDALTEDEIAAFQRWIAAGAAVRSEDLQRKLVELRDVAHRRWNAPEHYQRPLAIPALAIVSQKSTLFVAGYAEVLQWSWPDSSGVIDPSLVRLERRLSVTGPHITSLEVTPALDQLIVSSGIPGEFGVVETFDLSHEDATAQVQLQTGDLPPKLSVSPDGERLAIAEISGALQVADLATRPWTSLEQLTPHADAILDVAWSSTSDRLLTASRDRTAKLFDAQQLRVIANYDKHERAVGGAAFADFGPLTLDETGRLRLWAGDNTDSVRTDRSRLPRQLQPLAAVGTEVFLTDGNRVRRLKVEQKSIEVPPDDEADAAKSDKPKTKTVYQLNELQSLRSGDAASLTALRADRHWIVAGDSAGQIWLWRRPTEPESVSEPAEPELSLHFLARP